MNKNTSKTIRIGLAATIITLGIMSLAYADIYINVVAVNGADAPKTSSLKFDLPGELSAEDILDASGLQVDYNVEDANYFVYGDISLKPKESKTFRIHVKDKWLITPDQVSELQKQIDEGYQRLGLAHNPAHDQDPAKVAILKDRLEKKIDYILNLQSSSSDSIDKRIDAYREYTKEFKRIQREALNVSYWRSDPNIDEAPKLIHLNIQVENPTKVLKHFKHKNYLPEEVKPEDVVEAEDFEVRYDPIKRLSFLFKEEDLTPGEKKKYTIGILDIWTIDQKDIDYLRERTKYAYNFLKDSNFEESAKFLSDRITANLDALEASQAVQRTVMEHISAYRDNKVKYDDAEKDVETLEKLLAVFREDLEKSKVENILRKMTSLKSVSDVSKVVFSKKFEQSTAWSYIKWILIFVGFITFINFVVWQFRSRDKKITNEAPPEEKK